MSHLLIDEPPLQVLPTLARKIGLNRAVFLQQLHYWLQKHGHEKDGERWVYNTYEQWHEQFPFWSVGAIKKIVYQLEEMKILQTTDRFNERTLDRTKWYAIDYSHPILDPERQLSDDQGDKSDDGDFSEGEKSDDDSDKSNAVYREKSDERYQRLPETTNKDKDLLSQNDKPQKIKALTDEEAEEKWTTLLAVSRHADALKSLATLLAEENKTKQVAITKVWRLIGERYQTTRERTELSDEAWAHGFSETISRGIPNIGYVLKSAKSYTEENNGPRRTTNRRDGTVRATEEDYREEDYEFHV